MFFDGALIDVAQDHALHHLYEAGLFELGLVFKGGTALRKSRLGSEGRFSTDLDFAVEDEGLAELLFEHLDGVTIDGFTFRIEQTVPMRRARLHIEWAFGSPAIQARVDITHELPWLAPQRLRPSRCLFIARMTSRWPRPRSSRSRSYSPKSPHAIARQSARDLDHLAWFSDRPFDEALVRRLTVLKVWRTSTSRDSVNHRLAPRIYSVLERERILRRRQSASSSRRWRSTSGLRTSGGGTPLCDVDDVEKPLTAANPRETNPVNTLVEAYRATASRVETEVRTQ